MRFRVSSPLRIGASCTVGTVFDPDEAARSSRSDRKIAFNSQ
jgi:hypothetical protein